MDREQLTQDLPVGGQAVIEGVMMRVPGKIVTAVRAADRQIVVREEVYDSLTRRYRLLGLPVLRGALSFFEMMLIGLKALNFSADVASQEAGQVERREEESWREQLALWATMIFSVGLGVGLFFFLPLLAAQLFGLQENALEFNLDGRCRASDAFDPLSLGNKPVARNPASLSISRCRAQKHLHLRGRCRADGGIRAGLWPATSALWNQLHADRCALCDLDFRLRGFAVPARLWAHAEPS